MQLKGTLQIIDWQESTDRTFDDGAKLSTATVLQDYRGDIEGKSEVKYLMNYNAHGDATFVGYEIIEGTISQSKEACLLIIKHEGTFKQGVAKSVFWVESSTNYQELVGISGSLQSTEGGQANFTIG